MCLCRQVHLRHVVDSRGEGRRRGSVRALLGLHRARHDGVVRLERLDEVLLRLEGRLRVANRLDALAEAVLSDEGDDLRAVLLRPRA